MWTGLKSVWIRYEVGNPESVRDVLCGRARAGLLGLYWNGGMMVARRRKGVGL